MRFIPHQNVNCSVITVTNTATALFTLINTAGSVSTSQTYYTSPSSNQVGVGNGLLITPEDGNIRLGYGITPTAALGTLLSSGTKYFLPNFDLEDIKLIRTSGNVSCSIDIVACADEDSYSGVAEAVTLEASSVAIGAITIASGGVASGALASGSVVDGAVVTLGAKADAKSTATDTTAVTAMQVLKEISYMEQNPASRAVTNAGTFPVQATLAAETTKVIGTVNISAGQSVTANAGTNLNTSLLALETGGNLAAAATSLGNLDNAVDGNYLNVNLNVAGTDVAAGAGAVSAQTLRTTSASDDPAVTQLTNIGKSINGAGAPTIDSYTNVAISAAANTADQALVAAPGANKQIWVYGINFTLDTAAGSASFQDEDNNAISGVMAFAANGGMAVGPSGDFAMPLWKVATNKALEVDTVTCGIKGSLQYGIVSV